MFSAEIRFGWYIFRKEYFLPKYESNKIFFECNILIFFCTSTVRIINFPDVNVFRSNYFSAIIFFWQKNIVTKYFRILYITPFRVLILTGRFAWPLSTITSSIIINMNPSIYYLIGKHHFVLMWFRLESCGRLFGRTARQVKRSGNRRTQIAIGRYTCVTQTDTVIII